MFPASRRTQSSMENPNTEVKATTPRLQTLLKTRKGKRTDTKTRTVIEADFDCTITSILCVIILPIQQSSKSTQSVLVSPDTCNTPEVLLQASGHGKQQDFLTGLTRKPHF
jgi:hypothetical protein